MPQRDCGADRVGTVGVDRQSDIWADLLRGDLRALYLAWLMSASRWSVSSDHDDIEDNDENSNDNEGEERVDAPDDLIEPPVPAGLGQLSAPFRVFADFFLIDQDLIAAAAEGSPTLKATGKVTLSPALKLSPSISTNPSIQALAVVAPIYMRAANRQPSSSFSIRSGIPISPI